MPQKFMTVIAAPAAVDRPAFRRRFREVAVPLYLERAPGLRGCIVNLVDVPRPQTAPEPATWPSDGPPYDVVIESWFDGLEEMAKAGAPDCVGAERVYVYQVAERIQLDHDRTWPEGERSPGVKAIYLVRRHADLSDAEAKQRWREHAPLARRHHAGMSKYVQNGVIAALTPAAPVVHGIAALHFPTYADLEQRLYDSQQGQQAIATDAAQLVAEAIPLYTSEYILRVYQ